MIKIESRTQAKAGNIVKLGGTVPIPPSGCFAGEKAVQLKRAKVEFM